MYKNLVDVAKEIVSIANIRAKNRKTGFYSLRDISHSDDSCDKQLTKILMKLEYDEVMAIQTIMYLGRDKDYDSSLTSDEIFLDYKKYIENLGINTKKLAIQQIVEKVPLGEYLTKGYAILGITL